MTEIKKTLTILKARWPEVALIIGLGVLSIFSYKFFLVVKTKTTLVYGLMGSGFHIALVTIIALLITGLQRTIYLEGSKRQSPITLLRAGKHFFWRMVGFSLIYIPVLVILTWLTFLAIKQFASIETGFWKTAKASPFIYQLCVTTASLILIKPLLLIFPLIVVLDCRISQSFKLLKQCKLLDAGELVILFIISTSSTLLWILLPSIRTATIISQHVLIIARTIIQSFISLMTAVIAVRFVGSLDLVYDNKPVSSDLEDLRKYTNRDLKE